ncbi:MAG TPA: hypothetical protein VII06_00540 [Chloroflexota bacterium]
MAARARVGELAAELFEDLEQPIAALAAQLPDALVDEFLQLLLCFDDHVAARELNREDIVWRALTAHLPGLAPTLDVLRAHLQEDVKPACVTTSEWCDETGELHSRDHCRLGHEAGYASYPAIVDGRVEGAPCHDPAAGR